MALDRYATGMMQLYLFLFQKYCKGDELLQKELENLPK